MPAKRLVVLISGSGSNLQALIDNSGKNKDYEVVGVISNRPNVKGLKRAAMANISHSTLDHTLYTSREAFDTELLNLVESYKPDIVALAGFMRILTPVFVTPLQGKMLNIHPSLLPKYAGLNTHQRAIDANDSIAGCTVHFVTEALDGGPPVIQASVSIESDETAQSLADKVLISEHKIFTIAINWLAQGRLKLNGNNASLDNKILQLSGYQLNH